MKSGSCWRSRLRIVSSAWCLISFWHWNRDVRDSVEIRDWPIVRVVRNSQLDIACQLADFVTVKQVHQALVVLRNQNNHLRAMVRPGKAPAKPADFSAPAD
jgi:hypothetical protein